MSNQFEQTLEAVYQFIRTYIHQRQMSPTWREIAEACHMSHTTVPRYLDRLEIQGRISWQPGLRRSIRLLEISEKR